MESLGLTMARNGFVKRAPRFKVLPHALLAAPLPWGRQAIGNPGLIIRIRRGLSSCPQFGHNSAGCAFGSGAALFKRTRYPAQWTQDGTRRTLQSPRWRARHCFLKPAMPKSRPPHSRNHLHTRTQRLGGAKPWRRVLCTVGVHGNRPAPHAVRLPPEPHRTSNRASPRVEPCRRPPIPSDRIRQLACLEKQIHFGRLPTGRGRRVRSGARHATRAANAHRSVQVPGLICCRRGTGELDGIIWPQGNVAGSARGYGRILRCNRG